MYGRRLRCTAWMTHQHSMEEGTCMQRTHLIERRRQTAFAQHQDRLVGKAKEPWGQAQDYMKCVHALHAWLASRAWREAPACTKDVQGKTVMCAMQQLLVTLSRLPGQWNGVDGSPGRAWRRALAHTGHKQGKGSYGVS